MVLNSSVKKAMEILKRNGEKGYLVGGSVRNFLLSLPSEDFDIAVSSPPKKTAEIFRDFKVIKTGEKHGTITVIIDSQSLELTTFRSDGRYLDHRRPKSVSFTSSLKEDLKRRDFTINAIAYSEDEGFIDYFGGIDDLKKGIIKAVGDENRRFFEDALRILRALRFSTTLCFEIEEKTLKAIEKNASLLSFVSKERIYSEISKIICAPYTEIISGFSEILMPIFSIKSQNKEGFKENFSKLSLVKDTLSIRLACLLKDEDYTAALNGLKADNKTKNEVALIISAYNDETPKDKYAAKKLLNKYGIDALKASLILKKTDGKETKIAEERIEEILKNGECYKVSMLLVNGRDLEKMGYKGAEIGKKLDSLLDEVMSEKTENKKEALLKSAQK